MPEKWEDKEEACSKKKKIEQRIKQKQKSKSVGRASLINFLKRKVLPMQSKKGREWVKKRENIKQEKKGQRR